MAIDVTATEPVLASVADTELRAALQEANLPTLLAVLAQLTGDDSWLEEPYRPTAPSVAGDHDTGGLSEELQAQLRGRAFDVLTALRDGRLVPAEPPTPERIADLLSRSLGGAQLPDGSGPMLAEELGLASRSVSIAAPPPPHAFRVLVIGAGFSGLLAARELTRAGIACTVVDKNDTVGGTWLENRYPGCGVDTPTHLYSFSFAQRADWPRYFAGRDELFEYGEALAREPRVRDSMRFGTEVLGATWLNDAQCWRVELRGRGGERETVEANVLITGTGFFNRPAWPDIPGLKRFAGTVVHTAQWPADLDLRGKRVAVIGTGASAMQLVPAIVEQTQRLTVFQRSPQWAMPHPNYRREPTPGTKLLMSEVPYYLGWYRLRLLWTFGDRLHRHVQRDPQWPHPERSISERNDRMRDALTGYIAQELGDRTDLLEKCLPTYPPYGKRPLIDNGWFRTMARDDVDLVTDPIAQISEDGVVTRSGEEFAADVLLVATGFDVARLLAPMDIRGRSGATLREVWGDDDPRAYLGISMPDFPNLFCLLGPNTFAGHGGSGILSIELEMRYVMELLAQMLEQGIASVECRRDVHDGYNDELDAALERTIWSHPGMTTYYRNSRGRIVVPMPWTNADYWQRTRWPNLDDYVLGRP